jgi:hypothetical protein
MASFRIPKAHHAGLAKLLALEEASKQKLLSALRDFSLASKPGALSKRVSSETGLPLDDVGSIITVLVSLYSLRSYLDLPTPELTQQICEAMIESGDKELGLTAENRRQFADYLSELLEARSLVISSKVVDIWSEHEHALCGVRIFTDLRPVFDEKNTVLATGVVHMLKLAYHETDGVKEIYIAMDDDDIDKLTDALKDAGEKAKNLKSVLSEAKITQFE